MFVGMLKVKIRWEICPTFVGDLSERRLEHRKETLGWPTLNRCQWNDLTLCLLPTSVIGIRITL